MSAPIRPLAPGPIMSEPARPGRLSEPRILRALKAGGMIMRRSDGAALYRRADARAGCLGDVPRHVLKRLTARGDLMALNGDRDRLVWPRPAPPPPPIPAPLRALRGGVKSRAPTALSAALASAGPVAARLQIAARRFSHDYDRAARPARAVIHARFGATEMAPVAVAAQRLADMELKIGEAAALLLERAVVSGASLDVLAREAGQGPEPVRAALLGALHAAADVYGLTPAPP